jgi:hypothetical protein
VRGAAARLNSSSTGCPTAGVQEPRKQPTRVDELVDAVAVVLVGPADHHTAHHSHLQLAARRALHLRSRARAAGRGEVAASAQGRRERERVLAEAGGRKPGPGSPRSRGERAGRCCRLPGAILAVGRGCFRPRPPEGPRGMVAAAGCALAGGAAPGRAPCLHCPRRARARATCAARPPPDAPRPVPTPPLTSLAGTATMPARGERCRPTTSASLRRNALGGGAGGGRAARGVHKRRGWMRVHTRQGWMGLRARLRLESECMGGA